MKFGIGQPAPRFEDSRLLTGQGQYTDDHARENMVRAFFLRSPHAHAKIKEIEIEEALAQPGVLGVFTGEDVVRAGLGHLPCLASNNEMLRQQNGDLIYTPPRLAISPDYVHHVGEIVAVVIAETVTIAQDAAELIFVDYEPLPTVHDPQGAIGNEAVFWPDCDDNVAYTFEAGDRAATNQVFDAADHIIQFRWTNNRVAVTPMEPLSVLAEFNEATDKYVLITGNQIPHSLRDYIADSVFKIPAEQIQVISPDVGGAFGTRLTTYPELVIAMWAANEVGRPVKWTSDRSEAFTVDDNARDTYFSVELALSNEGQFQAIRVSNIANMGAYLSLYGPMPSFVNSGGLAGVYRTPHIFYEVKGVLTHTSPTGPYRGAGRPEMIFCIERAIDLAAQKFGFDRFDLRRRNMISSDHFPYQTALSYNYDSGDFAKLMDHAYEFGDIVNFETRRQASVDRGLLRGLGITFAIEQTAGAVEESIELEVTSEGGFKLLVGTHSHGQSHETTYRQVLSDHLKIEIDQIEFIQGDTDQIRQGKGTFGSRSIAVAGAAIVVASETVVDKAKVIAADQLEVAVADVELNENGFAVVGTDREISWQGVVDACDNVADLCTETTVQPEGPTYPNALHLCEVEIDPETGELIVDRYSVVDDVGTVINPKIVDGQIQGGVVQGIGQVIGEHILYDPDSAQLLTGSFMDYYMPRAGDMPSIEVASHPAPTPLNPLGVKGVGEAGTVGALSCTHSAVLDAVAPLGIEWLDMPLTAQKIWQAIKDPNSAS
jgi:aerobic carbon-monoxide dehydrogenase large subunit